jgi:glycogen debranching enzyme
MIEEAYKKAIIIFEHCAKPSGFYASGLKGGYEALWSRDSMTTSLGACFIGERFKDVFGKSLELLSQNQSLLGQIPNCVGDYNSDRKSRITFNTIDSTLWYIVGNFVYAKAYNDKTLLGKFQENIEKAFLWLRYQDPNEDGLLAQQPTMDWQDAFPHKYGRTINTHALYYAALNMSGQKKLAERIKKVINGDIEKYLSLYDEKLGYYKPWAWKNHDGENERGEWFDTLGNLLAIITGLATPKIAESILKYSEEKEINKPYPCKAIFPSIKSGDNEWRSYFSKCLAKDPYQYLNGGIWPFIGGFYVAALVKAKDYKKAEKELNNLAEANKLGKNMDWEFNEWLDGKTGKPKGNPYQGWSAGAYVYAFKCLKEKKALFFS